MPRTGPNGYETTQIVPVTFGQYVELCERKGHSDQYIIDTWLSLPFWHGDLGDDSSDDDEEPEVKRYITCRRWVFSGIGPTRLGGNQNWCLGGLPPPRLPGRRPMGPLHSLHPAPPDRLWGARAPRDTNSGYPPACLAQFPSERCLGDA